VPTPKSVTLQTERLTLRPLAPADAANCAAIRYHPEVVKWMLPAPADPLDAARVAIERYAGGWRERGYGPWGVFHDSRQIGHAGLNFVPEFGETEVLWSLHPDAWGRGFATEAARAALELGFRVLDLKLIFAITRLDNIASQAVMKRLGLTYRRDVVYRDTESVWYDLTREDFLRRAVDRGVARGQHRAV
jgi:RimJ/RimL family protein N-acetyltransferase